MRYLLIVSVLALTGCSVLDNYQPTCPGLRPYDPQLCRGEKWQQIPNFENEAQKRRANKEYW
jgi:hypothetical protein